MRLWLTAAPCDIGRMVSVDMCMYCGQEGPGQPGSRENRIGVRMGEGAGGKEEVCCR